MMRIRDARERFEMTEYRAESTRIRLYAHKSMFKPIEFVVCTYNISIVVHRVIIYRADDNRSLPAVFVRIVRIA